jgi:hypothetical protein
MADEQVFSRSAGYLPLDPPVEVLAGRQYVVGIDIDGKPFLMQVQQAVVTSFAVSGTVQSVLMHGLPAGAQAVDYRHGMDT